MTFEWETNGGELLMMALPHHVDILVGGGVEQTDHAINTIKGDMVGVVGDVWTMEEQLTTIEFFSPGGIDSDKLAQIQTAITEDIGEQVGRL